MTKVSIGVHVDGRFEEIDIPEIMRAVPQRESAREGLRLPPEERLAGWLRLPLKCSLLPLQHSLRAKEKNTGAAAPPASMKTRTMADILEMCQNNQAAPTHASHECPFGMALRDLASRLGTASLSLCI